MKKVLIIQRRMTHYRIPFFNLLLNELLSRNISLIVAAGEGHISEQLKSDKGVLDWAHPLRTHYFFDGKICWQPFGSVMNGCDLVVFALENKLLWNVYPQFFPVIERVALWGHGANLQGNPSSLRECFKKKVARRADWWFGYTNMSMPLISATGFPRERITILNNSIDLSVLKNDAASIRVDEKERLKMQLGCGDGPIGIYLGSLYKEKCIPFMLDAARQVHERIPDFRLLVVGAGPDEALVKDFAAMNDWAFYVGSRQGREKALYLSLADIYFNPGLLGLGILDAFTFGLPVLTTDCGLHSPEIDYLRPGENGLISLHQIDSFVDIVISVLESSELMLQLKQGSQESAKKYSIDRMVSNFADGIESCLNAPVFRFGSNL